MAKHFAYGADRGEDGAGRKPWAAQAEAKREEREAEERERLAAQQAASAGEWTTEGEQSAAQVAERQASVQAARERAAEAQRAALEAQAAAEAAAAAAAAAAERAAQTAAAEGVAAGEAGALGAAGEGADSVSDAPQGAFEGARASLASDATMVASSASVSAEDAPGAGDAADEEEEDNPLMDLDDVPIRRRRSKKSIKRMKRLRVLKVVGIFVGVIAVIVGGVAFAINSSIARGRAAFEETMQKAVEVKTNTVTYDGKTYELNEHMVSVCFIGFDNRTTNSAGVEVSGQSDTVLVVALNTDTGEAKGILIPRDSMVPVDIYVGGNYAGEETMQICLQYAYGESPEQSSELVAGAASRVLDGMPIDYYFTLNIEGVGPINDSIGGVTLTPTQSVPSVGIVEGQETTLLGTKAERYVQWRDTSDPDSSAKRATRQVSYLRAFASEVLDTAKTNPSLIIDLYNTASDYTWTNLGIDEFSYLATTMLNAGVTSFDFTTLEGEWGSDGTYAQLTLDSDNVYRTVLDTYYHEVADSSSATTAATGDAAAAEGSTSADAAGASADASDGAVAASN